MNFTLSRCLITLIAVLAMAMPALAHHSFAMFDLEKHVPIKGTVAEFHWINPHAHIILNVTPGPGVDQQMVGEWDIECASTNIMGYQGWTRSTVKAGDVITVIASPLKNGAKGASLFYVVLPDGTKLYRDIARPKEGKP